jgi:hypothetical protein
MSSSNIYIEQIKTIALDNKYTKWYISILSNSRYTEEYGEKHHILPKCFKLGGEKDNQNIVKLTAREHFICHLLLVKMFSGKRQYQMNYALQRMCIKQTNNHSRDYVVNSVFYETAKRRNSKYMKENNPNKNGDQAKKAWTNSSIERRNRQSEIMSELNKLLKSKPKEFREYECITCKDTFYKEEFKHHHRKLLPFCCLKCAASYNGKWKKVPKYKNKILPF